MERSGFFYTAYLAVNGYFFFNLENKPGEKKKENDDNENDLMDEEKDSDLMEDEEEITEDKGSIEQQLKFWQTSNYGYVNPSE